VKLWRDPILWLLQFTNLTYGFACSWLTGYVDRCILSLALSSDFIGFAGALISGLACVLSSVFGLAQRGKFPVLALGALSFLALGVLSRCGTPVTWGWGTIVFYVLMGVGRAVWESTNKAVLADFFPGAKSPGVFANVFIFSTSASSVAFVLGAVKFDFLELVLLITCATLTVPSLALAWKLSKTAEVRRPSI